MTMQAMAWWNVQFRQFAGKAMHCWKISGKEQNLLCVTTTLCLVGLCVTVHGVSTDFTSVRQMLAAFGECIMICKPKTNTRRKGDSLWEVGVFLGKTETIYFSQECMVKFVPREVQSVWESG